MIDELNSEVEQLKAAILDELIEIQSQKNLKYLKDKYTSRERRF